MAEPTAVAMRQAKATETMNALLRSISRRIARLEAASGIKPDDPFDPAYLDPAIEAGADARASAGAIGEEAYDNIRRALDAAARAEPRRRRRGRRRPRLGPARPAPDRQAGTHREGLTHGLRPHQGRRRHRPARAGRGGVCGRRPRRDDRRRHQRRHRRGLAVLAQLPRHHPGRLPGRRRPRLRDDRPGQPGLPRHARPAPRRRRAGGRRRALDAFQDVDQQLDRDAQKWDQLGARWQKRIDALADYCRVKYGLGADSLDAGSIDLGFQQERPFDSGWGC